MAVGYAKEHHMRICGVVIATVVASILAGFGQQAATAEETTRIVGGSEVAIGELPFICSVRQRQPGVAWTWNRAAHLCGATIVNENWLLTSAHCVFGKEPASLVVICGVRQAMSVTGLDLKPDYVNGQRGNDLALIRLKKPLVLTSNVQPVPIFDPRPPMAMSRMAMIVGYGASTYGKEGYQANGLQAAIVPILTGSECMRRLGSLSSYLTVDMVCTDTGPSGSGTCVGDSGGPVLVATDLQPYNLLAIPAWTISPCGSGPSMHTLVSAHIDWILSKIIPNLMEIK